MADGHATVVRDPNSETHGVLYDLALSDVPALDRYEEVSDVIDAEFWSMLPRLHGKPTAETDLPLLRELVLAELWPMTRDAPPKADVKSGNVNE